MIGAIENGMVARWKEAIDKGIIPYKLKSLASYGGQLDDMAQAINGFPAVYFAFSGAEALKQQTGGAQYLVRFSAIIAATDVRNEAAARRGNDNKPGSYQIALDTIRLIAGQKLGLEIGPVKVTRFLPLANNRVGRDLASIIEVDFTTTISINDYGFLGDLDDFKNAHVNWDVPPIGEVRPALPDDANADATQDIRLPHGTSDFDEDDFNAGDFDTEKPDDFAPDNFNPEDFKE